MSTRYMKVKDPPTSNIDQGTTDQFKEARDIMKNNTEDKHENPNNVEVSHDEANLEEMNSEQESITNEHIKIQKLCEKKARLEKKKISIEINDQSPYTQEKLQKWIENEVYEEIDVNDDEVTQSDIQPISVTWVITDDNTKRKAHLVARGFQEEALHSTQTESTTCRK